MFVILLIVKFLDPLLIALAVVGGLASRTWWHVLLVAFVVAGVQEAALFGLQQIRTFNPIVYLAGVPPAWCWATLAYLIRKKWVARRNQVAVPPQAGGPVP